MGQYDGTRLRQIMVERGLTLAVAESLTSGNLQVMIGSISGASDFFEGGITAYSLEQKARFLQVDPQHASEVNSVSQQVASEMACGVCRAFDCDLGIGTTGYAEPYPKRDIQTPFAYVAIWQKGPGSERGRAVVERRVTAEGLGRAAVQRHIAEEALRALLDFLERIGGG